jgi:hypothetical protein
MVAGVVVAGVVPGIGAGICAQAPAQTSAPANPIALAFATLNLIADPISKQLSLVSNSQLITLALSFSLLTACDAHASIRKPAQY